MIVIRLTTTNDIYGNPRRVFIVLDQAGNQIDAIDEGYEGIQAVHNKYPDAKYRDISFRIEPEEYNRILGIEEDEE